MATTVAELQARLGVDRSGFDRGLAGADAKFSKVGRNISKAALGIATVVGGSMVAGLKVGWDEFKQGQLVGAQTNAVLASTKGVANVTAREIDRLSESLMKKTGVDDEAIKAGQNMLLTFTKVRNEAGKGNDVFSQATKTTLDMSVALGKDMKDASILTGKALNDPIRGMTALRRVGVSFTTAQEKQIKKMQESGNTMGAQKLILRELNKEFGGSAEAAGRTLPGQLNILKESFSNFAGELVGKAIPRVLRMVELIREHSTVAKVAAGILAALAGGVLIVAAAMKVWRAGVIVATAVQWAWNAAMTANPIGLVIVGLVALGAGLVLAYKKSETFRKIVQGALSAVIGAGRAVLGFFRGNWKTIAVLVSGPFAPVVALATDAFGIRSAMVGAFRAIMGRLRAWGGDVRSFLIGLPSRLAGAARSVGTGIKDRLIGGLSGLGGSLATLVRNAVNAVINIIRGFRIPGFSVDPAGRFGPTISFGGLSPFAGIPTLASGGIVTRPTLALLGERGPEAVVPLQGPRPALAGPTLVFNAPIYGANERELADEIFRLWRRGEAGWHHRNGG